MNSNYDFWFWLAVIANFTQLESYNILLKDFNNNDLMKYLQHQDNDLLNKIIEQNEIIIQQNTEIIELLKGGKNNASYKKIHSENSR